MQPGTLGRWAHLLGFGDFGFSVHLVGLRLVRTKILENVIDRVFEARTRFVSGLYALRYKLAHFKTVDSLRERAMDLI
jgi:hypothetical protein